MKRSLVVAIGVLTLSGCVDFDDAVSYARVEVRVVSEDEVDPTMRLITLTSESQCYSVATDDDAIATFSDVVPDVYDISCNWSEGMQIVAGSISGTLVDGDANMLTLRVSAIRQNSLVIGKIYYAGGKDYNNKNYDAGRFIELYNNSADTVMLAGLYLGLTETESTMAYTLEQATDTIFLKQVFRFPDVGKQSVAPGESVVVTNSAIDHTQNGPNEYNLLEADFECEDKQGNIMQNATTPKMDLVFSTYELLSYMNFINGGPNGFVLFATNEDVANWGKVYAYQKQKGNRFLPLPIKYIVDGVETVKFKAQTGADYSAKRLYDTIDAGGAWVSATSGRNGQVVCRKVEKTTADGRKILADTNNSTIDFITLDNSAPRNYE